MGMTRDTGKGLEITLPMVCHLTAMPGSSSSQCVFYPYAPLSADETVLFPYDHIAHRSSVNEQFIPLYDNASASWFKMIENKSIPLKEKNEEFEDRVRDAMSKILRTENEYLEEELELLEEDISKKTIH